MSGNQGNGFMWAMIGCAGLLVLGLCVATGIGVYVVVQRGGLPGVTGQPGEPLPPPPGGGGTPPGGGKPPPTDPGGGGPIHVEATVRSVTGSAPVAVGDTCTTDVEQVPREEGGYWCRAQITCAGKLLYGGPQSGYFPCTFASQPSTSVRGQDDHTTRDDQDASLLLDTDLRQLTIADDATGPNGAFGLEARITAVQ
ncbi:MAG: hypothetical protein U0230_26980 [Polyangiales bacterium]